MARIWYQSGAPLGALPVYANALETHVKRVASPDTEIVFHGIPSEAYAGHAPAQVLKYAYARHLILGRIIENCILAERQGYDGVALGSYNDAFVREARSVVEIPVVSSAESSLLTACSLAMRFALITLTLENVARLRDIVERHGLTSRVCGVYSLEPATNEHELSLAFAEPKMLVAAFANSVERAVADGAELVIAAEGVLNEVLFAHGITRILDVPVLDCIGNLVLHAEMMINLKQRTGLSIGRRYEYAKPSPAILAALRKGAGLE